MYKNILIPTDGSELAGNAVKHGIIFAKEIGAKITVLTVTAPFHFFALDPQVVEDTPDQYKKHIQEHTAKMLGAIANSAKRRGLHARPSRSSMNILTKPSSILPELMAVTSLRWPRTDDAAFWQSSSAAKPSKCSRTQRFRFSSIADCKRLFSDAFAGKIP